MLLKSKVSVFLLALIVFIGYFAFGTFFITPQNEPVEAAEREYYTSISHLYNGGNVSYQNYVYCYVYLNCDSLGISSSSSITFPSIERRSTWLSFQYEVLPATSDDIEIYWYPTSLNFTIRLTGYSWVNSYTQFSATWAFSIYSYGSSKSSALNFAKEHLGDSRYSRKTTYTRSGDNFSTSSKLSDAGDYSSFFVRHSETSQRIAVLYIDLEKPTDSVSLKNYTLYFNYNGGIGNTDSKSVTYNSAISTLPNATRENYIFNGWYIDGRKLSTSTPWTWTSDQTATARWEFDGYTLTYSVNNDVGGSIVGASTEYLKNTSVVVTASPDNNYVFSHWVLNGETLTINPLTFTITQNSTLTAYFTKLPEVTSSTGGAEFATFNTETLDLSYRYNITFTTDNYLYSATVNTGAEQRIASMNGMLTVPDNSCTAIIYYTNQTGSRLFLEIIGVTGDVTINLTFSNVSQSFSPTSGGGASGIVVSATEGGVASVVGDDFENLADDDEILYIAKLAQNGYQFSHWEDAEGNILGYTDNLLLTKAEAYNTKVIAVFIPTNQENTNSTTDTAGDSFQ